MAKQTQKPGTVGNAGDAQAPPAVRPQTRMLEPDGIQKEILEGVRKDPDNFRKLLREIRAIVGLHKAFRSGVADTILYMGPPLKKEAAIAIVSVFEQMSEGGERKELAELRAYFAEHYEAIRREVYK